jgi:hypothetical protein
MIVAIYLIASTMLAGLSWVGLITGGIFTFLQLPLDFHTLGFLGGLSWVGLITGGIFTFLQLPLDFHTLGFLGVILLFVVGGIKWMLGCG